MKKAIWITLASLLLIGGALFLFSAKIVPVKKDKITENIALSNKSNLNKLSDLGFRNAANVKVGNYDSIVNADYLNFYEKTFGLKFFSPIIFDRMLKENDLVRGSVNDFTGKIPEEKISEIYEGRRKLLETNKQNRYQVDDGNNLFYYLNEDEIEEDGIKSIKADGQADISFLKDKALADETRASHAWSIQIHYAKAKYPILLYVVAPKEQFNLTNAIIDENNHITKHVDPAVFAAVKGGYVLLASW